MYGCEMKWNDKINIKIITNETFKQQKKQQQQQRKKR